jgi:hypothetical protein
MLMDKNLTFTEAGATGNTGTRVIGDVIDLGAARDIGAGEPVYLNILVQTGITVASSTGTIQFKLTSATDSGISSGTTDHFISAALATSTTAIPAGTVVANVALPSGSYGRYLAVQEVVATTNTNAGKIAAFLSKSQAAYRAYDGAQ